MLVEQLVSHRLACFELVGFAFDRAQRSSERLAIRGSELGVENMVAASRLAPEDMFTAASTFELRALDCAACRRLAAADAQRIDAMIGRGESRSYADLTSLTKSGQWIKWQSPLASHNPAEAYLIWHATHTEWETTTDDSLFCISAGVAAQSWSSIPENEQRTLRNASNAHTACPTLATWQKHRP